MAFSFRAAFVFVDYQMNYELFSQVLCENKDKPELQCNGKCHMMKEMAKTTDDSSEAGNTVEVVRLHLVEILQDINEILYPVETKGKNVYLATNEKAESLGFTPPTPPPQLV